MPAFEPSRRAVAVAAALAAVLVIGYADYATGVLLRLYPLYFLPISLAAWHAGRRAGLLLALFSTAVWEWSNALAGRTVAWDAVSVFNGLSQFMAFGVVAFLTATQRRRLDEERRASRADALTGVANTRAFYEAARAELARARRYGHPLTVAYLDLDDFKSVNDRLGHPGGDDVLRRVAEALRGAVRQVDTVARMGGDEFVVLLPETGRQGAAPVLEKLARVATQQVNGLGAVTVSLGGVTFETLPATVEAVVARADALMYEAKRAGKNTTRLEVV